MTGRAQVVTGRCRAVTGQAQAVVERCRAVTGRWGLWLGRYWVILVQIAGATNIVLGSGGLPGRSVSPKTRKMSRTLNRVDGVL